MEEEWVTIPEFDRYAVSNLGRVKNSDTGRIMKQQANYGGTLMVGLVSDGVQNTRSVKILVAEAFVAGKTDIFSSVIYLDGDHLNVRADNLKWRPRWFVLAYSKQFHNIEKHKNTPSLIDNEGNMYGNVIDAAIVNGMLINDIIGSTRTGRAVFPDWKIFAFYK